MTAFKRFPFTLSRCLCILLSPRLTQVAFSCLLGSFDVEDENSTQYKVDRCDKKKDDVAKTNVASQLFKHIQNNTSSGSGYSLRKDESLKNNQNVSVQFCIKVDGLRNFKLWPFELATKSWSVTTQIKITEEYVSVILFANSLRCWHSHKKPPWRTFHWYKVILTLIFVEEILKCDYSNEDCWPVVSGVYYTVVLDFQSLDKTRGCDHSN